MIFQPRHISKQTSPECGPEDQGNVVMELDLQHKPKYKVDDISFIDVPLAIESNPETVSNICALLEDGSNIVCITDRAGDGDSPTLARLSESLPGFVAWLDHSEYSDLAVSLAKSLSLGSDETDEKILQSRWHSFSEVAQRSSLPFTLIVPNADSLSQSRLVQIQRFLRPINGRLILTGYGDFSKLFDAPETAADETPPDTTISLSSDSSIEQESTHSPELIVPIADISTPEPPIITDVVLPEFGYAKPSDTNLVHTPRRLKRNRKPLGWMSAGLALGGVLGFLIATLPVTNGLVDVDRWFKGLADISLPNFATQSVQPSETASAVTPDGQGKITHSNNVPQQENVNTTVMLPTDTADDHQDKASVLPKNTATADEPTVPVAANPVTDLAALEKAPTIDSDPEVNAASSIGPTTIDSSAASKPIDPQSTATEGVRSPEMEPVLSPEERARIAAVFLSRAEREWEAGNLQQTLLEVVRGLDAEPDNIRLQELRQNVLAEMNGYTQ